MPQSEWDLGRWRGVPVSLHWTALLIVPWLVLVMHDLLAGLIGSVAFFALLVVHEGAHVFAARRRGVQVHAVRLEGLHGETVRDPARGAWDEVLLAWSGVLGQLAVLGLALALAPLVRRAGSPALNVVAGPILEVLTAWNLFLIVVALLPIGPFDGHAAWRILPLARRALRRRRAPPGDGKVVTLDPARRRALERDSQRRASEIIDRLRRK